MTQDIKTAFEETLSEMDIPIIEIDITSSFQGAEVGNWRTICLRDCGVLVGIYDIEVVSIDDGYARCKLVKALGRDDELQMYDEILQGGW